MSTCYIYTGEPSEADFRNAAISHGAEFPEHDDNDDTSFLMDVGGSYSWVEINDDGNLANITQYGIQKDDEFIYDIAAELGMSAFSEHDEGFQEVLESSEGDTGLVQIDISALLGG